MLQRSQDSLSSLKKISQTCSTTQTYPTASIIGIIIDMTKPLYRQRQKDYIIQLKIIDDKVNQEQVYGILVKYCSVYLFAKEKNELEVCNMIGQIVYLNRFTFNMWNQIKLETKYRSTIEKLYTFDLDGEGRINIFGSLLATQNSYNMKEIVTEEVEFRIKNLGSWFRGYFYQKYKPTLGINLVNNYCVMAQPFNMILRKSKLRMEEVQGSKGDKETKGVKKAEILEGNQQEGASSKYLYFQDSHGNKFKLQKTNIAQNISTSEYFFIRNIKYIGNFYQLTLTQTGYLLGLPQFSNPLYQSDMNYCAISRFNQRFLLKNHKTCNLSKINYVSPKTTPLIDLHSQIDLYQNKNSQRQQMRVQQLYMVQAVVINYQGKLHMFHKDFQMIADEQYLNNLSDDQKNDLLHKGTLEYLYEGVLGILDRSSQCLGKLMYVHLFSNQSRGRFFDYEIIEELNRQVGLGRNKGLEMKVKEKIEAKLQRLVDQSDFMNTVSMLLETIKSDVLIYRVTNTIFQ